MDGDNRIGFAHDCSLSLAFIVSQLRWLSRNSKHKKAPHCVTFSGLTVRSGVIVVWNADLHLLPAAYQSSAISTRNDYLTCLY
jgi:hypothetical protein